MIDKPLRLGDALLLIPAQGTKKSIILKRNEIDFILAGDEFSKDGASTWVLPLLGKEPAHFRLIQDKKAGNYKLKALGTTPFILNGCFCLEAYLEKSDVVILGYHKLIYAAEEKNECYLNPEYLQVIKSDPGISVLIQGETGTGKSSLAKTIHERSDLLGRFVQINISSFNEGLVESELFGHKKGSFTGAIHDKNGAFVEAQNGTLFIDEIDSLSKDLQTKLLLFLDEQYIRPVGSSQSIKIKTRLIFASGKSLKSCVKNGQMREDFYYRICSGFFIELKPLRKNREKITSLCENFCLKNEISISPLLIKYYQSLNWPGNYRQLLGHLQKKKALAKNKKLILDHWDTQLEESSHVDEILENPKITTLKEIRKYYCSRIYHLFRGNLKLSSEYLGIGQMTLKNYLELPS